MYSKLYGGSFFISTTGITSWNKITNISSEKTIDKYKHTFYNYDYEMKQEDPSNHTSGVGAPLKWTGLHT